MNKKNLIFVTAGLLVAVLAIALIFGADWDHIVGISYKSDTDVCNAQYRQSLEKLLQDRGIEVITVSAQGDADRQLEQVQALADQDCDVLLVEPVTPVTPKALSDTLEALELPAVVTGSNPQRSAVAESITYLNLDPAQAGTVQAQMAAQLPDGGDINGDGVITYVVLQGPEEHIDATLRAGALQMSLFNGALQTHQLEVKRGQWTVESGKQMCLEALSAYGIDIEMIFCGDDRITQGAAAAIAESGWVVGTDFYLFGIGTQADTLSLLQNGQLSGTVAFDGEACTQFLADTLYSTLVGEPLPERPALEYTPVLPE